MTMHDGTTDAAAPPALLIVDADPQARAVTESALARRFGADYRVVTANGPQAGLDALERLAEHAEQVALVAADLHLPGMDGMEFLERAHLLHRDASRSCCWPWTATTPPFPSASWRGCSGRRRSAGSTLRW
jgi:thioredoxin reductase (NADPH)